MTVKDLSQKVHDTATELASKIEQFIEKLTAMPGRVEIVVAFGDEVPLYFARQGKGWTLKYGGDQKLLSEAPLRIKMAAIDSFPLVLQAIKDAHQTRLQELNEANKKMDSILKECETWDLI